MTDAISRVRAAIALRDAAFAAIEANKCLDYTDDDLHELTSALIDAAPEMLRAVEELEAAKADLIGVSDDAHPRPALPVFLRAQADRAEGCGQLSNAGELRFAAEELERLKKKTRFQKQRLDFQKDRADDAEAQLTRTVTSQRVTDLETELARDGATATMALELIRAIRGRDSENARLKDQVRRLREALMPIADGDSIFARWAMRTLRETGGMEQITRVSEGEDIDGADLAGCNPLDYEEPWEMD